MKVSQKIWTDKDQWKTISENTNNQNVQLVLAFGSSAQIVKPERYSELQKEYPAADIVMGSTAGEILGSDVIDDSIVVSALEFEKTQIQAVSENISDAKDSNEVAKRLGGQLPHENLSHAFVFSEGLIINGSDLVDGLLESLPKSISITGGLVGDGSAFKNTFLSLNGVPESGKVILVGLYGDSIKVGFGSLGGWDPFGIERTVTKSDNNIVYELDGKPALELYKSYLGDKADGLPSTGLLFPLSVKTNESDDDDSSVVRTLLAIDEEAGSLTFAGKIAEGSKVHLMKANFERLIDGASGAASLSIKNGSEADFALLVSCVGRKLVLKQRTDEEVEAVREVIGTNVPVMGFYSYGEICPTAETSEQCKLHNQTMTITILSE